MAKDVFTEVISDVKKNPGLSMDSIMKSKETVWKPRFERCDEIEKESRQSETSSFEEEMEKCESAKDLESLMDTLARLIGPEVDWEIPENNSNIGLCECLVAANSEEEALKCAPDKTIDQLMEILTSECLEMAEALYNESYPVEEVTEADNGKEKNFKGVQLFFTDSVTEDEAVALGEYLVEQEFANGEEKTVQLNKTGKAYQFRMVVKKGAEKNSENIRMFKVFAAELSENVFKGEPVEIHICDNRLETIQVVIPE
jgi:hypothetical protein